MLHDEGSSSHTTGVQQPAKKQSHKNSNDDDVSRVRFTLLLAHTAPSFDELILLSLPPIHRRVVLCCDVGGSFLLFAIPTNTMSTTDTRTIRRSIGTGPAHSTALRVPNVRKVWVTQNRYPRDYPRGRDTR